mmetsp:Transcript_42994/g.103963  ORF Transcript_42994/g.103963 Transcript_42994/m.103963 type:complete len:1227 (+) Transcript_42994:445-4125(+)
MVTMKKQKSQSRRQQQAVLGRRVNNGGDGGSSSCLHVVLLLAICCSILSSSSRSATTFGVYGQQQQQRQQQQHRQQQVEYSFADLKPCTLTSPELANLSPEEDIEPCIIYDVQPTTKHEDGKTIRRKLQEQTEDDGFDDSLLDANSTGTDGADINDTNGGGNTTITKFEIPIVQVTPSGCNNHRDGAMTGVEILNADNDNRGVAIGYTPAFPLGDDISGPSSSTTTTQVPASHFAQFRLVSVVAGNPAAISVDEYERRHVQLLSSMLETLKAPYIVGTCSFVSALEKAPANEHKAILMAQVGPPTFYEDSQASPYVFGFHINSDKYPLPSVRSLAFWARREHPGGPANVPVRVISRTESEFFSSTCKSAIAALEAQGFKDIEQIWMDHSADEDGDGTINQFDEEYLESIADRTCPPAHDGHDRDHNSAFHPALFVCSLTEQDVLIPRWVENGCRPVSFWLTASTWTWATDNPELVPYVQGGGQWHESFDYSDKFFSSGIELIRKNKLRFGYAGNYDQVVSYAIPVLYAEHLVSSYRVVDEPNPVAAFASAEGRELLRRDMVVLTADTIFGPISFDANKRNVGREAAGSQWLQQGDIDQEQGEFEREQLLNGNSGGDTDAAAASGTNTIQANKIGAVSSTAFTNTLVYPFLQASAPTVVPAPSAQLCQPGNFGNETSRRSDGAMLESGCSECPVDTFLPREDLTFQCTACPPGSTTNGLTGQTSCVMVDDNLLSTGVLIFGYVMVAITWLLCFGFLGWIWFYRNDPVVNVSQKEFLVLICIGALISSSTIISLSFQAGSDDDTSQASIGCTVAPFLYTIGWALQYSSLTAKTFRLFTIMKNNQKMRRVKVTVREMSLIVVFVLVVDIAILVSWTVVSPLVYERSEESINVDANAGVITIETVGSCVMENSSVSFWAFAGPLMGIHFMLLVITNVLLCFVRDVSDRYQEQKYVGLASMLMFETLIVGLPVLVAVNDSPAATHIILVGIIALGDIGILCFTFVPKIYFQRAGLEEGVGFGESIMKDTHRRASTREMVRRDSRFENHSRMSSNSPGSEMDGATSKQMAMAAAVVRSKANQISRSSAEKVWHSRESLLSSVMDVSICESDIQEENHGQEAESGTPNQTKKILAKQKNAKNGEAKEISLTSQGNDVNVEQDRNDGGKDAQIEHPMSTADGTATTTSLTEKGSARQRQHGRTIPRVIETNSSKIDDADEEGDGSSSSEQKEES